MEQVVEKQPAGKALTPYEMQLIVDVLNTRTNVPGTIRDLKLIQGVVKSLNEQLPAKPERPNFRKLNEGEKEYPKEELAAMEKAHEEYLQNLRTHMHNTEVSVDLSDTANLLIKQRLQTFTQFQTDAETRERILKLAEKFGL